MQDKILRNGFRTVAGFGLLFIVVNLLFAFRMNQAYGDIWQQLGMSKNKGEENIRESFMSGYLQYYGARNFRNIVTNDRAAITKDLMNQAKQHVGSESFRKHYESIRNSAKPVEYPYELKSKEDIRKEKIAEMEKSITEAEALVKKMPEMEKNMRETINLFKQQLKDYKDPNSQMIELFYQGELNNKTQREKSFEESMDRWNTDYPEDYKVLIRKRLQHFIELAKTVDFNAELKEVNGKKKFVNPKYEGKSYEWKQVFRAGKEVIDPAVTFSEQWLRELK